MLGLAKHTRTVVLAAFVAGVGTSVGGDAGRAETTDVPLFTISKSENKNQVQYVIRVDDRCAPASDAPISAHWLMLEQGPSVTEPLLKRELPAYGPASQSVVERTAEGGKARLTLMAMPNRPIAIDTFKGASGGCQARPVTSVAGADAHLFNVYVKLKWPVGVSYLLLQGWSLDGKQIVTEKLE